MTSLPRWSRLLRFVAAEDGKTYYGEPTCDSSIDIGLEWLKGKIKARILEPADDMVSPSAKADVSPFSYTATESRGPLWLVGVPGRTEMTVKKLLAPLAASDVQTLRCIGLNYKDHAEEAGLPLPPAPILFYKPSTSLAGPADAITIPKIVQDQTDYEAELCVVIGKTCKDVPVERALDVVAGYTAANDLSARKLQFLVSQWGQSKSFDGWLPIGPVLVAPSQIPDPSQLSIRCHVDDEVLQDSHTSLMVFNVQQCIAHLSQGTTLEAGSIIAMGTPAGVGMAKKPALYLKDGQVCKVEIGGGIGTLVNKVVFQRAMDKAKL